MDAPTTVPSLDVSAELEALQPRLKALGDQSFRNIGQAIQRKEDLRLLTGRGQFSDDFALPDQTYAAMVRSPYPHARILRFDVSGAKEVPGVLAVLTGEDCLADRLGDIPHNPVPSTRFDLKLTAPGGGKPFVGPHFLLPIDKVRHVGEAVAIVVARSPAEALDGAERVVVDYEELPHVSNALQALNAGAPTVWDEVPGNLLVETFFGDHDGTDAAFASADHIVSARFHVGRVTAVPLEPRAALAHYEPETQSFILYAGSGGAVRQKHELAKVLGIEPSRLRVVSLDVGGNFGARNRVYVEFGLVLWASRRIGRPVKFTATRSEAFLTDYQGRDLVTSVELALSCDGRFLALRADNISNVGARCVSLSPLAKGSALITGSYDIPYATLRARAVFTNTMSTQAYRSSGRPEVTYAIERIIEIAARELQFDPIDLRRKNLIPSQAMPYTNAVGSVYDSGEYERNMDRALELFEWEAFVERKARAATGGKLLGRGIANYVESSIGTPKERAELSVKPDSQSIEVVIGTQPSGQGHETSFAQVIADLLGVSFDQVAIVFGDTAVVSVGGGSHSGRSMRHAGTVMAIAAASLIAEGRRRAGHVFEVDPERIEFKDGHFFVRGANLSADLFQLARQTASTLGPFGAVADNEMHTPVYPNGTAVCEVEVDPDTGHVAISRYVTVDDVGRCINPLIVHGQTHGGIAQGVGQAMWEQCVIDPESGQPLCGSFMDYGMPRADTLPAFTCEIAEVISPTNPLGVKAGGEGGTTPALAAVVNATVDALKCFGVTDLAMPLTPYSVWRTIQEAQRGQTAGQTE